VPPEYEYVLLKEPVAPENIKLVELYSNCSGQIGNGVCVIDGVGVILGLKLGVILGLKLGVILGVTLGLKLGVILGVTDTDGVGDTLIVGVIDDVGVGVTVLVGVTDGVGDGIVGQVPQAGLLTSVKGQPPVLKLLGSDGIGNTHQRVKSWSNDCAPENI